MSVGKATGVRLWRTAAVLIVLAIAAAAALATGRATASPPADAATFNPKCNFLERFSARDFPRRPKIHNTYLPMIPWVRTRLDGEIDGVRHRVQFTVTDLVKKINGVNSLVIWDTDTSENQLVESELSFFAEDEDGNVWNLGEYPEELEYGEDGALIGVSAPNTWIAGQLGAKAGIHMREKSRVSSRQYIQGLAPAIDFFDCAKVVGNTHREKVCVDAGCWSSVVITYETNLAVPDDGVQSKYHAPGVGIIKIGVVVPETGEELQLVERKRLRGEELRAAREAALELDARGYELGLEGGYDATSPAKRLPPQRRDDDD
jgi:hypothetical protein